LLFSICLHRVVERPIHEGFQPLVEVELRVLFLQDGNGVEVIRPFDVLQRTRSVDPCLHVSVTRRRNESIFRTFVELPTYALLSLDEVAGDYFNAVAKVPLRLPPPRECDQRPLARARDEINWLRSSVVGAPKLHASHDGVHQ
jgi:hypothetical protein